jgi:hypothetical protein
MLTITDSITSFCIRKEEAIELECKLNVTRYRKIWSAIGDSLYAFGTDRYKGDVLLITTLQLEFIELLRTRSSWKNCYDL